MGLVTTDQDRMARWCVKNISRRLVYMPTHLGVAQGGTGWMLTTVSSITTVKIDDPKMMTIFLLMFSKDGVIPYEKPSTRC